MRVITRKRFICATKAKGKIADFVFCAREETKKIRLKRIFFLQNTFFPAANRQLSKDVRKKHVLPKKRI